MAGPFDKFLSGPQRVLWTKPCAPEVSDDGRFVFDRAGVYDLNQRPVWKPGKWGFVNRVFSGSIFVERYFETENKIASRLEVYDTNTKKRLWDWEWWRTWTSSPSPVRMYFDPDEVGVSSGINLYDISSRYFATTQGGKIILLDKNAGSTLGEWAFLANYQERGHWHMPIILQNEDFLYLFASDKVEFFEMGGKRKWTMPLIEHAIFDNPVGFRSKVLTSGKSFVVVSDKAVRLFDNSEALR